MNRASLLISIFVLFLLAPKSRQAATWVVGAYEPITTIQAGIDSASVGDTVFVTPGRYVENINFLGKDIVVKGTGPEICIIDGSAELSPCVQFTNGESHAAIIEQFEITGGSGFLSLDGRYGGGIFIESSEPTILNNRLNLNTAIHEISGNGNGGAISISATVSSYEPWIMNNVIRGNLARQAGGISFDDDCVARVVGNDFIGNRATDGDGGAIILGELGGLIENNLFYQDQSWDKGGAIYVSRSENATIRGNVFNGTRGRAMHGANGTGSAIYLVESSALIQNNTFRYCIAEPGDLDPGGTITALGGSYTIRNNLFADIQRGGIFACIRSPNFTVRDNLFWDNAEANVDSTCGSIVDPSDNIFFDPLFCDNGFTSTLAENSPALTHAGGTIGANRSPGCPAVTPVLRTTWGSLKMRFKE